MEGTDRREWSGYLAISRQLQIALSLGTRHRLGRLTALLGNGPEEEGGVYACDTYAESYEAHGDH